MENNYDQALEVDVLAAALSLDRKDSGDILELLARKFQGSLPQNTKVERKLLGLGAIASVTLCFDDYHYQISRERYGAIAAKTIKIIRGVKIKTTEIPTTEWSLAVAQALARMAANNAQFKDSLSKFILG
jgi:hypothetical protein